MIDIQILVDRMLETVERHRIAPGQYARWMWQDAQGDREMGCNPYGCADAANILYTLAHFPADAAERQASVEALQAMQDPETGLFHESTHHPIHTTAHCTAALELFEARPAHPLTALLSVKTAEDIDAFLAKLDWQKNPWPQSHQGAGLYASMKITESVDARWEDDYFAWMWEHTDPVTGFVGGRAAPGAVEGVEAPLYDTMAGSFHYFFNHEHARRPWRYPDRVIDSCFRILDEHLWPAMGREINFAEIDVVYCISRAMRKTTYRYEEAKKHLEDFARDYVDYLISLDPMTDDGWNDLHALFGAVCCLAELQQALPGFLRSDRPLRLVLDRRPFI